MGMDISCIGGIGFEISELLAMYDDHKLTKDYYNEEDEDLDKYELIDEFFSDNEYIDLQCLHSYDDTEYYVFAEDPIKGVQAFIDELVKLGFEDLNIDDLDFYSEAQVW
jgi:hypothetical protein